MTVNKFNWLAVNSKSAVNQFDVILTYTHNATEKKTIFIALLTSEFDSGNAVFCDRQ